MTDRLRSPSRRAAAGLLAVAWLVPLLPGCATRDAALTPTPAPAAAPAAASAASAVAPAAAPAPRRWTHRPAPRTGPGGSTVGALHGGMVLEEQGVQVEVDAQIDQLEIFLREQGQALSAAGATGHITLLNGVDITDAYLEPSASGDRLTIRGDYPVKRGTRLIVRVQLPDGRRLSLRYLILPAS